ncbi:MAG: transketolase [Leptospiraceae bacterium]|nr:MAG: transketolase [Leptospiraceae bacterium]
MIKSKSKLNRKILANAIRILSIDAIERAKSGHPGAPMGMADIAEVLWNDFLKHNPKNPNWWNRDRFVLSNGHASMLIYALLHLSGYDITIDDIKNFRQLHSKTPGHPEYGHTPGIETTTGPLGQGFANAVGMALAEKILAQQFNRKGFPIIDHYTYVFVGDGCLMEGISHEAASLAGKWQLEKLIVFYDNNSISIDGHTSGWFIDDTKKRFESYDWHVIDNIDGHNPKDIIAAIKKAQKSKKPSLLICNTTIGFGSPNKAGKESVHGAPLGSEEIQITKENLRWEYPPFEIPQEIYDAFDARSKGEKWEEEWNQLFEKYKKEYPDLAKELERRMNYKLPEELETYILSLKQNQIEKEATRKTSQRILNEIKPYLPELIGGSADLTHSNLTIWEKAQDITIDFKGDYIYYGVREFGMFAIMNGLFLHGGFRPFGGTFLVFSDYGRNAIRMSALMKLGIIYIFTHDSIGLGEDGPTHQPIEHLPSLRIIPNLQIWRPYNYHEVLIAWKFALKNLHTPTILVLSRQNIKYVL